MKKERRRVRPQNFSVAVVFISRKENTDNEVNL
jgi:hypothetical protein